MEERSPIRRELAERLGTGRWDRRAGWVPERRRAARREAPARWGRKPGWNRGAGRGRSRGTWERVGPDRRNGVGKGW